MSANTLFTGDNLPILQGMRSESVDLIYLDPPFNSKRMYKAPIGSKAAGAAFKDMWKWTDVDDWRIEQMIDTHPSLASLIMVVERVHGEAMAAYLCYMSLRLIELHRILKSTGSIYLHCDPTASHYLKGMMDVVFGKRQFRNEIVWHYGKWANTAKHFQRNHDTVLFYTKTDDFLFNNIFVKRINRRPYCIQGGKVNQLLIYDDKQTPQRVIENAKSKGRKIIYIKTGAKEHDVWSYLRKYIDQNDDLDFIKPKSKERTGYPTQKPLALLNRIIKASSNPGDMVLDPFCGCATACVAAQNLGRNWIGIDISPIAAELVSERLATVHGLFTDFSRRDKPPLDNTAKVVPVNSNTKNRLVQEFGEKCNGCGHEIDKKNLEIDHVIPKSKGGGDHYANYQLLCGHCNKTKGNRPQEYLLMKIKKTQETLREKVTFGMRSKN